MKKFLSILVTVILLFCVFHIKNYNTVVCAESEDYYTYTISNGEATITKVSNCAKGEVTIPSKINGYLVVGIGDKAFKDCDLLTSVIIPNSVTSMGDAVFSYCKNLINVTIPDSVISMGLSVFDNCKKLKTIKFSNSITYIPPNTFNCCTSLKEVNGCKNVTTIDIRAFKKCESLKSITIYKSVNLINDNAFQECSSLTDVWYVGTKEDKSKITIKGNNIGLRNATWHYNVCEETHMYSNDCESICNSCGFERTPIHNYLTTVVPATLEKDGSIIEKCDFCSSILNQTSIKRIKSISLTPSTYLYNGNIRTPDVVIKDYDGNIISSNYYNVSYQNGRKNVGEYNVTIKLKDHYSGSKTLTFTIVSDETITSELSSEAPLSSDISHEPVLDNESNVEETVIEPKKTETNEKLISKKSESGRLSFIIVVGSIFIVGVAASIIFVVIRKKKH